MLPRKQHRIRTSYVAIIEGPKPDHVRAIGPYLSMKKAEGLVQAWSTSKFPGYVLVIEKESDFLKEMYDLKR